MHKMLTFALVGILAQLVDGALGMAYGVTATSFLLTSGVAAATASASVHLAEVGTTLTSGISHWRMGNVNWRTVRWIALPGAAGAYFGATILSNIDGKMIRPYTSSLLLILGVYVLARFAYGLNRKPLSDQHIRGRYLAPLGLVGGFVDAIGGGGWGPVTTPALLTSGRMQPRTAIGSVSISEFVVSLAASIGFLTNLGGQGIDGRVVAGLLVGGVLIAPWAAWLCSRLAANVSGTMVGVLIVVTNIRILMLAGHVSGPTRFAIMSFLVVGGVAMVLHQVRRAKAADKAVLDGDARDLASTAV